MSELPNNWVSSSLETVCDIVRGITFPASAKQFEKTEQNVCCLRTTNIQREIQWENVYFVSREYVKRDNQFVQIGDVLMSMANSYELVGKVAVARMVPYDTAFGAFLSAVRPKNVISGQYLFHFLRSDSVQSEIREGSSQTTNIANISVSTLSAIRIPLAPINEQKRIAGKLDAILARVDDCRERLDRIPAILKRFRQALLAAATSGKLTEEWRKDRNDKPWATTGISVYGEEVLESLASSWIWTSFSEIAEIKSNLVDPKEALESIHLAPNHVEGGSGRILEISTVRKDKVKSNKHQFHKGQIVYSKIRPYLNKVVLVDFDGVCSADMYPINATIEAHYLLIWMLSARFVEWASQKQGRVVLPKINQNALNKIPVPVPPIEEQTEIVRRVESLFAYADRIEARYAAVRAKVDKLTPAILAKAFRGELVPQDPDDEPASVLLERIRKAVPAAKQRGRSKTNPAAGI